MNQMCRMTPAPWISASTAVSPGLMCCRQSALPPFGSKLEMRRVRPACSSKSLDNGPVLIGEPPRAESGPLIASAGCAPVAARRSAVQGPARAGGRFDPSGPGDVGRPEGSAPFPGVHAQARLPAGRTAAAAARSDPPSSLFCVWRHGPSASRDLGSASNRSTFCPVLPCWPHPPLSSPWTKALSCGCTLPLAWQALAGVPQRERGKDRPGPERGAEPRVACRRELSGDARRLWSGRLWPGEQPGAPAAGKQESPSRKRIAQAVGNKRL